ncbi:serine phosphatase RsbU (regulator of sigma subunit) [Rubrivivax gelatinosus]|uniref:biofilm regulation protein phosphatase SiaA n=1 Tax=Rubrivivax gelatinosus TaxID=28068 RepID=UPI0018C906A2|nr:biofilm regulation protein phosphatase SiaA [Rubrivivax gelatinosus]MBG6081412.1 serine phosphatase RsbU (regulator of sigma subunit) [Rubrivivax gelatinosus]
MATWGFGLRAKSILALVAACLLALLPASLLGWQLVEGVRDYFGEAYARNYTQLKREQILGLLDRELALAKRLAGSQLTRQWLADEDAPAKKTLALREAEAFRLDLHDHAYFIASGISGHFFFNDDSKPFSAQPRYTLDAAKAEDSWFFATLRRPEDYNINVNVDVPLQITMVWFNVVIRDRDRAIGVAGAGLNLREFLAEFINTEEAGVTPIILARSGAIQAHRDTKLISTNQAGSTARAEQTLAGQLADAVDRAELGRAMENAAARPGQVASFWATLDGRRQLLALSYVPELKWYVVTAVDLKTAQVLDGDWLRTAVLVVVGTLALLLTAFALAVHRLVIHPLRRLHRSATAISHGDFQVSVPADGRDEIADLGRAFATMAEKLRAYTENLEREVQERTQALEAANRDMRAAHQKISDSIDYASLIQRAILPARQLTQQLGEHHFVLWRPRDVVGGDFYVFRADGPRYLIGVVDCAGHGVPGALMTMLARAALDHAMSEAGIASPAEVLRRTDAAMRAMLQDTPLPRAIATNMDAGLVCVDLENRRMVYAGAKIPLFWSDGETLASVPGGRRAIGDRRQGEYSDEVVPLRPGTTYTLVTDGYLDQSGGELGYGFGNARFASLLREVARRPLREQAQALEQALGEYQGEHSQRDDITILSFRFD